jgi:hypothetical protein
MDSTGGTAAHYSVSVACPVGTTLLGGGAMTGIQEAFLNDSGPNQTNDGWSAAATWPDGNPGGISWAITVYARCGSSA